MTRFLNRFALVRRLADLLQAQLYRLAGESELDSARSRFMHKHFTGLYYELIHISTDPAEFNL